LHFECLIPRLWRAIDKYSAKIRKKGEVLKNNLSFALFLPRNMLKPYHSITDLQQVLFLQKESGHTVGFVPTMGALHQGHISLITESKRQCGKTVASIFVNPTQFNDILDYERYPQYSENDRMLLEMAGCDYLFLPDEKEMYPSGSYKHIDFDPGPIGNRLEGSSRPGHFAGMAAVVKRLFDIVKPDKAFFGLKDYQQYLIVKKMVAFYNLPIEIVGCPIIREENGLAMSSRNARLTASQRAKAGFIYKTLTRAAEEIKEGSLSFETILAQAKAGLAAEGDIVVDYIDICSADSLEPATEKMNENELIIPIAVYMGEVRLIDNIIIK
jgi:pantoate--beta-alanine ligase